MKLLLTACWPVGGIRTYLRYIYTQPLFRDVEITLLAPDMDLSAFCEKYLAPAGVDYIPAPKGHREFVLAIKSELDRGKYDVLHSHGYSSGVLGCRAIFGRRLCHVMTAHDVFRQDQFRGLKGKLKWLGLNSLYRRLDRVLTVGEDCQANFERYMPLVRRRRIVNIDHGVDTQRFATAHPRNFRHELGLPKETPLIGFFGRFMAQKGFIDLVNAIDILSKTLPESSMPKVLTFGWGGFVREDFAQLEALGLSKYFLQLPFTDEVPEAVSGVDMVAMPSRWEACGLLAMEVLAAGKPLIASHCQGLRCVVRGTPVQPVPPRDPEALARAILSQMAIGPSEFESYKNQAVNRFGLTRPAIELYKAYTLLLEDKQ